MIRLDMVTDWNIIWEVRFLSSTLFSSISMHAIIHIILVYILTINREEEANRRRKERERTARPMKGSHKEEVENTQHMGRFRVLKFKIIMNFRLTSNSLSWWWNSAIPSAHRWYPRLHQVLCAVRARSTMKRTRETIDKIANKRKSI